MRSLALSAMALLLVGAAVTIAQDQSLLAAEGTLEGEAHPGGAPMMPPPHMGSPELERLKGIVGRWEGRSSMGKGGEQMEMDIAVEYHIIANGSAVVERNFPGTPMEMMSVYHDRDGELAMTHYCMLGNQPQMTLESTGESTLSLSFAGGVEDEEAPHMRGLTISFDGPDRMSQTWTMFEGGEKGHENTVAFHRAE